MTMYDQYHFHPTAHCFFTSYVMLRELHNPLLAIVEG